MACSCKAKSKTSFIDPLTKAQDVVQIKIAEQEPENTLEKSIDKLDMSSNTVPDQLCFNCVRKHLGLAYMFIKNGGLMRQIMASGQLMCASTHLFHTFPKLSQMLSDQALLLIRTSDPLISLEQLEKLINLYVVNPQKDLDIYLPVFIYPDERRLLVLSLLYCLLFVQITYQEVNKTWATAYLSYFSYLIFRDSLNPRDVFEYRALWKLIQSMQPYDDNYLLARQLLQKLVQDEYRSVIQSIPVRQNEIELQEAKRETFLKQLQEEQKKDALKISL